MPRESIDTSIESQRRHAHIAWWLAHHVLLSPGVAAGCAAAVILLLGSGCDTTPAEKRAIAHRPEPVNPLVCRLASYGRFQDIAWTHLPSIGVRYVFMNVPPPDQVEVVKQRLAKHGLAAMVLRGETDLSKPDSIGELAVQLGTCQKLGVRYMFLSPKRRGATKETVYQRLREAGDVAHRYGVTITLETHPDLGTNGDVHVETMKRINHPNIRVNFDTGNITYYNKGANAVVELRKCMDYVGTVELKDHSGGLEEWSFPTLGQGAVDLAGVVRMLKQHGYAGPITLEIEGVKGIDMTEAETRKMIEDSVAYVRSLGQFR
ncbi:MAG: sugar phosphate isomerase/epimerase [Phycisphaerae bacterium]|nr:sugar phosphate isomerase/epimerase [Phycisphaerae bacterium]